MSMPEATPAEVMTPSSTTREERSTVTPTPSESRRSREAQWVVARRPSSRPALPRSRAPVQTEETCRALAAVARIQSRVASSSSRGRVPKPPGTTRRSIRVPSAKPNWGVTTRPPVAVMGSRFFATVKTRKGALSSDRRDSTPGVRRVRENTSKGPAKSSTSTLSKRRMPTLILSMSVLLSVAGPERRSYDSSRPLAKRSGMLAGMEELSSPRQRFAAIAGLPDERIGLAEAALWIAAEEQPGLDPGPWLARLDEMAERLRPRLEGLRDPLDRVERLSGFLTGDVGLRSNADDYYDPRNSYLNEVIERGLGIPITLSVLYMELGRKIGLPLEGVSFPGQ